MNEFWGLELWQWLLWSGAGLLFAGFYCRAMDGSTFETPAAICITVLVIVCGGPVVWGICAAVSLAHVAQKGE